MPQDLPLELISFKICPFVQRSVIALNEKQVDFKLTHIYLANLPDWFKEISPMGKVPVLKVGDDPVFESVVILEYLDEVFTPQLHPDDSLTKAMHRSWMEYCSDLIMTQYRMFTAKNQADFEEQRDSLKEGLQRLESVVAKERDGSDAFFAGEAFTLVDTVYAPLFMRLDLVEAMTPLGLEISPRIQTWSDALLARESVKNSVDDDFETAFKDYFQKEEGYIFC